MACCLYCVATLLKASSDGFNARLSVWFENQHYANCASTKKLKPRRHCINTGHCCQRWSHLNKPLVGRTHVMAALFCEFSVDFRGKWENSRMQLLIRNLVQNVTDNESIHSSWRLSSAHGLNPKPVGYMKMVLHKWQKTMRWAFYFYCNLGIFM
jgi:hypothetical protein